MASEWIEKSVAELQAAGALLVEDGNHGEYRPLPNEFSSEGVHFIRAADMDGGRVLFESAQRINEFAQQRIRKGIGAGGDVLLSHKGTVGKVAYVLPDAPPFVCSPQTTFWRVKDLKQLDRRYVYYYLLSRAFREQLDSRKGETDMADYVSLTTQRTLKVIVPPLAEQRAIARMLGALDDKIELNRQTNATLAAIARALFQSWFVDFDPVRAKLDGRAPAGLDPITAALFPATFQDSSLGPIPHGWEVCRLSEKIQISSGGTPNTSEPTYWGGDIPWYSVRDAPSETDVWVIDTDKHITELGIANSAAQVFPEKTTIISARGTVGKLALTAVPMAMNQSCYGVRGIAGYGDYFTYHSLREATVQLQQRTHGTVFDTITTDTFNTLDCMFPTPTISTAFDGVVEPLFSQIRANLYQSRTLAALRELLLPKLLSGDLGLVAPIRTSSS